MVKTTKILLIFLQTFEGNVGKKIFFGVFVGKEENRKGAIKPWPLCTPLGLFFRSSWLWWCKVVDLCMYAAVLDVWGWADVCGCGWCWMRTARRVAVAWLRIFFIFCLRRGGGYMYSWKLGCLAQGVLSDILEEEWWFFWICAGILVCVAGGGCIIVVSLVWGIVIDCFCWLREVVIWFVYYRKINLEVIYEIT